MGEVGDHVKVVLSEDRARVLEEKWKTSGRSISISAELKGRPINDQDEEDDTGFPKNDCIVIVTSIEGEDVEVDYKKRLYTMKKSDLQPLHVHVHVSKTDGVGNSCMSFAAVATQARNG